MNFLRVEKGKIVDREGKPVMLRGTNAGGWLMMEGYILHSPNRAERLFKENFAKVLGKGALKQFEEDFRNNFIREDDLRTMKALGFNCLRVPFNYRLIEPKPFQYSEEGLAYLDRVIGWGKKYGIWIILDLHAAPGAQNHDWHSDSLGTAELWKKKSYQERVYRLWEMLAGRYKNEEWMAGYDLLNEAVMPDTKLLNEFYKKVIKAIRKVDRRHLIFVEGNNWAQDLDSLEDFEDENLVLSVHTYQPLDFTFNFVPFLSYPLHGKRQWGAANVRRLLEPYRRISIKRKRPIYVGEFGVNVRQGLYNEQGWVKNMTDCFEEFGFHWTYWTYKAVKNACFPDGIFSYLENAPWVNRSGPLTGWETYHLHWKKSRKEMINSWRTQNFYKNTNITDVLHNAARKS